MHMLPAGTAVRAIRQRLVKRHMAREDHECICFCIILVRVVGKNSKTPKFSPVADDAITCGCIGGLGSLVHIFGRSLESKNHTRLIMMPVILVFL